MLRFVHNNSDVDVDDGSQRAVSHALDTNHHGLFVVYFVDYLCPLSSHAALLRVNTIP